MSFREIGTMSRVAGNVAAMHAVVSRRPRWKRVASFHPAVDLHFPACRSGRLTEGRTDRRPTRLVRQHEYLIYRARSATDMRVPHPFEAPDTGEDDEAWQEMLEGGA